MVRIGLLKTKLLGTVRILRKELGFSVPGESPKGTLGYLLTHSLGMNIGITTARPQS